MLDYSSSKFLNGIRIDTLIRKLYKNGIIEVEAGSTNLGGGYFRIEDKSGTNMGVTVNNDPCNPSVEIGFAGDAELRTFAEALRFAAEVLEAKLPKPEE